MTTRAKPTLHTMALAYQAICQGASPWIPLGMFSHDFFGNFVRRRKTLVSDPIAEPPEVTPELHRWTVFCAASVEYLCQKYGLPCPDWVNHPAYRLAEPWYYTLGSGAEDPEIRAWLEETTPEAFTKRNIYCGDRVWANKYEIDDDLRHRRSA